MSMVSAKDLFLLIQQEENPGHDPEIILTNSTEQNGND